MCAPTRKLYYEDPCSSTCTATVLKCTEHGERFEIVLDQTCFYPEGGGQPGDTGTLNETAVFDTHEKGGCILHYTKEPIETGTQVMAAIDRDRRFDLMQQHSGEHIVSGIIHRLWGYKNVGFHMGADVTTIDLSGKLTMEQLTEVEAEANRIVWKNDPVHVWYPSAEELPRIPYRSKKELEGDVRIVEFPGADICACCGTHVERAGAIGLIKIISCETFHEGVRVELLCGGRALRYLSRVFEQNRQISQQLSAKPLETAGAVGRLAADLNNWRQKAHILQEASFLAKAQELADAGDAVVFLEELDADGVRRACDAIQKTCGGRAAVFSGTDETGYAYAIGLPEGDLRELTKAMNSALNGRGGGKPSFVQGRVLATAAEIRRYFS